MESVDLDVRLWLKPANPLLLCFAYEPWHSFTASTPEWWYLTPYLSCNHQKWPALNVFSCISYRQPPALGLWWTSFTSSRLLHLQRHQNSNYGPPLLQTCMSSDLFHATHLCPLIWKWTYDSPFTVQVRGVPTFKEQLKEYVSKCIHC